MIINNSVKTAIMAKFNKYREEFSEVELLATEILFYKYILSLMSSDVSNRNNANALIDSYIGTYKNKFIELKQTYTSYLEIILFLKKIEGTNILSIKESEIDEVYKIYKNSKLIQQFNIHSFDETVYSVDSLDGESFIYLKKIHFKVMVPIIKYYMKVYGVDQTAMKIISASEADGNVGKKIIFCIDGIPSTKVFADIIGKKFPIKYVSAELKFPHVELINA
jgi:hypothetical protein